MPGSGHAPFAFLRGDGVGCQCGADHMAHGILRRIA